MVGRSRDHGSAMSSRSYSRGAEACATNCCQLRLPLVAVVDGNKLVVPAGPLMKMAGLPTQRVFTG